MRQIILVIMLLVLVCPYGWTKNAPTSYISSAHIEAPLSVIEDAPWAKFYVSGIEALNDRRYQTAETALLSAIKEARQRGGNILALVRCRNALARLYLVETKYHDAQLLLNWSLDAAKQCHNELEQANSLQGLATIALESDQLEKAEKLARQALAIRQRVIGAQDKETAQAMIILGGTLGRRGLDKEAEELFGEALAILEKQSGTRKLDLADALRQIALFYRFKGLGEQAASYFEHSYQIEDKATHFAQPPSVAGAVRFDWEDGSPRSMEFPDYDVPLKYFTSSGVRVAATVVDLWELMGILISITNVSDRPVVVGVTTANLEETKPRNVPLEMVDPTRIDRVRRELQMWDITYKHPWLANMQKTRTNRGFVPAHGHDLFRGPNIFGIYGDWGGAPKILPQTFALELSPEKLQSQSEAAIDTSMMHSADINYPGLTNVMLDPFESRTGELFFMNPRSEQVLLCVPIGNTLFQFPFKCRKRRIAQDLDLPLLSLLL